MGHLILQLVTGFGALSFLASGCIFCSFVWSSSRIRRAYMPVFFLSLSRAVSTFKWLFACIWALSHDDPLDMWSSFKTLCVGLAVVDYFFAVAFLAWYTVINLHFLDIFRATKLLPGKAWQHAICWGWASVLTIIPFFFSRSYEANAGMDNGFAAGANFDCWVAPTPEYFFGFSMFISLISLVAFSVEYWRLNLAPIIARKPPLRRLHNFLRVVAVTWLGTEIPRFIAMWTDITEFELTAALVYAISGFVESLVWFAPVLPSLRDCCCPRIAIVLPASHNHYFLEDEDEEHTTTLISSVQVGARPLATSMESPPVNPNVLGSFAST